MRWIKLAKTRRIKTITAGRLVRAVAYDQATVNDGPRARAEKRKLSSAARRKMNFTHAYQNLQMQLAANFAREDLYITLTYDAAHLPENRKRAKREMQNFIDRLRRARRRAGKPLEYIYVTHELTETGRRLHHHLILKRAGGNDAEVVCSLWGNGENVEVVPISESGYYVYDDFIELAQYLLHERNPDAEPGAVGDRGWCASRGLKKPEVRSELVEENVTVTAPPGAFVLDRDHRQNEYGTFDYIVYLLPIRRRE